MPSLAVVREEPTVKVKMELISLFFLEPMWLKRTLFPMIIWLSLLVEQGEMIDNLIRRFRVFQDSLNLLLN